MATHFQDALRKIAAFFDHNTQTTYTPSEIAKILAKHKQRWNLPQNLTQDEFVNTLPHRTKLETIDFALAAGPTITRFTWGTHSPYKLALSLRTNS